MARVPFKRIRERAARRKGGEAVLATLLPKKRDNKALAKLSDDRVLAEMARRVFSAGFVWSVIDKKWPGFEEAFLGFNPKRLLFQPAEFWEKLASDKRIVRNPQKIKSVRENAKFVSEIAAEHGSFGKFLAAWPADDQIGLLDILAKRGSRLGGYSGQYLLRFLGRDSYVLSGDVLLCLRDAGVALSGRRHLEEGRAGRASAAQCLGAGERPAARSMSRASARCRSARTTTPPASRKSCRNRKAAMATSADQSQHHRLDHRAGPEDREDVRAGRHDVARGDRRLRAALHRLARGLRHGRPCRARRLRQRRGPRMPWCWRASAIPVSRR